LNKKTTLKVIREACELPLLFLVLRGVLCSSEHSLDMLFVVKCRTLPRFYWVQNASVFRFTSYYVFESKWYQAKPRKSDRL